MKFFQRQPNQRHNLVLVALHHFPGNFFKTSVGITLLAAPFLLNYFSEMGVNSLPERVILNGLVIVIVPASLLFILTLFRSPQIRKRKEAEAESELQATTVGLRELKAREQKEENEIIRLQQVVTSDRNARRVKDEKEEERWDLLNERLRVQEETGQHNIDLKEEREVARQELASEERLLVAQQVKDIKDEGDVTRKGLVSDGLIAQGVKDRKEDDRWDVLNEKLRVQDETGQQNKVDREIARQEFASGDMLVQEIKALKEDKRWDQLNERLRVQQAAGKENDDLEEIREFARQRMATGALKAQQNKNDIEDERWNILHDRLRIQEEKGEERDRNQLQRDDELRQMRKDDRLRDQYHTLLARYIRQAASKGLISEVADGLAPIPDAWLHEQPEIRKAPALMLALIPHNER